MRGPFRAFLACSSPCAGRPHAHRRHRCLTRAEDRCAVTCRCSGSKGRTCWLLARRHDKIADVTDICATVIKVVALLFAGWALISATMNRRPTLLLFAAAVCLEALLLGFVVGEVVQMAGTDRPFARAEFVVYLLACLAIPPVAFYWARGE